MKQPLPQRRRESPGQQLHALSTAAALLPQGAKSSVPVTRAAPRGGRGADFPQEPAEAEQPGTLASAVLQGSRHQCHQITFPRRCDTLQHLPPYPATSDLDCHKETLRKDSATLRPALEGSDAELGVENHRAGEICCL